MESFEELAGYLIRRAENLGARAEVRINVVRLFTVKAEDKKLSEIEAREERSLGLKVVKGRKCGFASTTDFEKNSLERLLKQAFSSLKEKTSAEKPSHRARLSSGYKIYPFNIPVDEKAGLSEELNRLAFTSNRIKHASTWIGEREDVRYFASSEGSEILTRFVSVGIRQFSVAKENGRIEKLSETKSFTGGYEFVCRANWGEFVKRVSLLCEEMLGASLPKAGLQKVVLDPKALGLLLHEALGHASEADLACSGNSALSNILGKRIASEAVTVVDSGVEEQGIFAPYDDEGIEKTETTVVENGILKNFLHTCETASRYHAIPTGNARAQSALYLPLARQCNYYMKPREAKTEELVNEVKEGLYITGTGTKGGHADVCTGSFTLSAGCSYEIKNGEIGKMVKNVSIGGSIFDVLKSVELVARDFALHYNIFLGCKKEGQLVKVAFGGPHVLARVIVGGAHS